MLRNLFVLFVAFVKITHSFSDIGKWDLPLNGDSCFFTLAKSLFKDSNLIVMLKCDVDNVNLTITYTWSQTRCSPDYLHYFEQQQLVACPQRRELSRDENTTILAQQVILRPCHTNDLIYLSSNREIKNKTGPKPTRRAILATTDHDGIYILEMSVTAKENFKAIASVEMVSPSGYLSAAVWPLLPFFGVMCGVYTLLCTIWLVVCSFQWRDLLRIQYWIGGVALMGMIESATFYGVYSNINSTGYFNAEVYMFAEWLSVAKRALARMLVIIVSLGFGIVKPRLGPALQRVVGTGLLWGLLGAINAWLRLHHKADDSNRDLLLSEVPLSLLDSAICWWVFVSLAHTMRTLQLRRNAIKLSLYRHFTNTLIFAVISSVVFMLYSIKSYRVLRCIVEWKEVWMDEAYWHVVFACELGAIMVLWRPTNNNQRYAFTPLLDNADDDEDEEEQFVNDAYGVKMRGTSGAGEGEGRERERDELATNSLDSDLRWVEENIPTSTLPLLDSDEEIINTKFEVSKMQ